MSNTGIRPMRLARTAAGENTIRAYFGRYDNGTDAGWVLRDGVSTYGGVVIGGTGSGKTHAVKTITVAAGLGDDVEVWNIDPYGYGVGSLPLREYADYPASSLDATESAVEQARLLITERGTRAARTGKAYMPTGSDRMVVMVVHSAHLVFADHTAEWAEIARLGRSAGVAVIAETPMLTITAFGESEVLRTALLEGNLLALPTTDQIPFAERFELPREVGHGLLSTPLDRDHRRVQVFFPVDVAGYAKLRRR